MTSSFLSVVIALRSTGHIWKITVEQLVYGCRPESKSRHWPGGGRRLCLIGLRQIDPLIFSNIDWGSAQVFEQTRQRLMQMVGTLSNYRRYGT